MHEMSIAMAVVEQVARAARPPERHTVTSVRLRIGELAGVVDEALRFSFDLACEGTPLAGARLETEPVAGRARCADCAARWATGMPPHLWCRECGSARCELVAGRELDIVDVRWAPRPAESLAGEAG
ncbi:hydrogenase maturation nickel metallochaperone HypA/HybF [Streptantibioticus cattleyicolor]|uniref:Hydrogenase maturation factor HypA n=1 Tax=Streptantibioticus cattleyicolor (strain ATCC 35852 / DSM 46488 / JCM 4925 / NBRC 14057 / NRRL 8057) TaxID=1003195 RepID=F8JM47_STREN|nr:hydrogenase maturation nickel metallochaperone HypA [Streptantibioticus cattleyicolor]AEW99431.1 hydrogenase expression/formation protein [Streptantibioticus cattleyicolor NRRL 8057 = DSM 46488]CCB71529.1 putative hydrogenase nickel incorporation protein hypA [Streptantibioticus cattleyicolor NRRL 8057 = DSM 46488]